jgi:hypothetical protein
VLPQVKVETSLRRVRADSRGALHAVYLAPIHRRTAASCAACRRAGSQRDCGRASLSRIATRQPSSLAMSCGRAITTPAAAGALSLCHTTTNPTRGH